MAMYVIYDRHSGEIVHTHVQPEEIPLSREDVLALVERDQDPQRLATLLVDPAQVKPEGLYRVDVSCGELRPVDDGSAAGFGSGAVRRVDSADGTEGLKVTYGRDEGEQRGGA